LADAVRKSVLDAQRYGVGYVKQGCERGSGRNNRCRSRNDAFGGDRFDREKGKIG